MGEPRSGFVFSNEAGTTINLEKLGSRVVRPAIQSVGIRWHGWQAFRRGLASNLYRLGVNDKVVQAILRHWKPILTRERYIKVFPPDVLAAMDLLDRQIQAGTTAVRRPN